MMIRFVHVTIASLIASRTLASFGTLQPAQYAVDDIRVDFGVSDGQCDPSSETWHLIGTTTDETEEWAIQLTLSDNFHFSSYLSTVDFQVDGERLGPGDMFFGFGDGSKYITMAVDFDGRVLAGEHGIQIYPGCGGSLATGDVANVLSNSKQYHSNAFYAIRDALAGGDRDNWEQMGGSEHNNGADVWPVTIEVTNNLIAGEVTVRFVSSTQDLECVYSDLFESDSELVFGLNPDPGNDEFNIHSITVAKSVVDVCDGHCDASAYGAVPMMDLNRPDNEPETWTVALSGKDVLIVALCAINVVVLVAVICSCSRFGGAGPQRKKYQVVSVNGDSEMEQFQN